MGNGHWAQEAPGAEEHRGRGEKNLYNNSPHQPQNPPPPPTPQPKPQTPTPKNQKFNFKKILIKKVLVFNTQVS